MSEWNQNFALTQNVGCGFLLLCPTPLTKGTVHQPHCVEMSSQCSVLSRVRRPVPALAYVLSKDSSLVLAAELRPEISWRASLWVLIRRCHIATCWLSIQRCISFHMLCLETPMAGLVRQIGEHFPLLWAGWQFHFHLIGVWPCIINVGKVI